MDAENALVDMVRNNIYQHQPDKLEEKQKWVHRPINVFPKNYVRRL